MWTRAAMRSPAQSKGRGRRATAMASPYQLWRGSDPYDARLANLQKALSSPRYHQPRPWRSRQETNAIKRLVWLWFSHNGPGATKESGRALTRYLGVSHTYVQKLSRKFARDPRETGPIRGPVHWGHAWQTSVWPAMQPSHDGAGGRCVYSALGGSKSQCAVGELGFNC